MDSTIEDENESPEYMVNELSFTMLFHGRYDVGHTYGAVSNLLQYGTSRTVTDDTA